MLFSVTTPSAITRNQRASLLRPRSGMGQAGRGSSSAAADKNREPTLCPGSSIPGRSRIYRTVRAFRANSASELLMRRDPARNFRFSCPVLVLACCLGVSGCNGGSGGGGQSDPRRPLGRYRRGGETSPVPVHEKISGIAAKRTQRSTYSVKILKTYDLVARVDSHRRINHCK